MRLTMIGATILLMACTPATAKPNAQSWGKAGVGFEQYRIDSMECATRGYRRDVSADEPAKRFLRGFRSADDQLNGGVASAGAWADIVRRTQPDRQLRALQAIMVNDVEQCLSGRGYTRFDLTRDEQRKLATYRAGSAARHQYLHALAAAAR